MTTVIIKRLLEKGILTLAELSLKPSNVEQIHVRSDLVAVKYSNQTKSSWGSDLQRFLNQV